MDNSSDSNPVTYTGGSKFPSDNSIDAINNMFAFITDDKSRLCIINGWWAINQLNLVEWLKNFTPRQNEGFVFSNAPELNQIIHKMEEENAPYRAAHSGYSFGWTMQQLKSIVTKGIDNFKEVWLSRNTQQNNE